jgi:hypothetical protein
LGVALAVSLPKVSAVEKDSDGFKTLRKQAGDRHWCLYGNYC